MTHPQSIPFADAVPWSDGITEYDRCHAVTYLRLLDAVAAGADPGAMARDIFGLDPDREADRAGRMVASHLRRAQWMMRAGYRHLLRDGAGGC